MDIYMSINNEYGYNSVQYHKTSLSAVEACGINPWETMLPAKAVREMAPGDEMQLTDYASVIRLTGKDTVYKL